MTRKYSNFLFGSPLRLVELWLKTPRASVFFKKATKHLFKPLCLEMDSLGSLKVKHTVEASEKVIRFHLRAKKILGLISLLR